MLTINGESYSIFTIFPDDLSLSQSARLKELIDDEIKSASKNIGIDISGIDAINSSGLGILISLYNKVKSENGNFKLINPKPRLIEIFGITKLNSVFDIYFT